MSIKCFERTEIRGRESGIGTNCICRVFNAMFAGVFIASKLWVNAVVFRERVDGATRTAFNFNIAIHKASF